VARDVSNPFLAWGEGGDLFFTGTSSAGLPAIFRLRAGTGQPELVLGDNRTPAGQEFFFPQQVMDGLLVFTSAVTPLSRSVNTLSLRTGQRIMLAPHAMGGRYLPTGHLIYYWDSAILAAAFEPGKTPSPIAGVPVVSGVSPASWTGPQAAISRDGALAYVAEPPPEERTLEWIAANGRRDPLPLPPAAYEPVAVSSNGTRILVSRYESAMRWSLWMYDIARGTWTPLFKGSGNQLAALWVDDDTIIASSQGDEEFANLVLIRLNAPKNAEPLMARKNRGQYVASWSPALKAVAYVEGVDPETKSDIWVLPLDGSGAPVPFVREPGWQSHPDFSPDGRWLAYDSGEGPDRLVYVKRYPEGGAPVVAGHGYAPVWSADGHTLYFRDGIRQMASVWNNGVAGNPHVLFEGKYLPPNLWTRRYASIPTPRDS
jgi:WD40-like Beta Propeller Repeat